MLSPSTSSFPEDETFWGFPAGSVKGGGGWEGLTRPFWVNFIVPTSLPFWPRFTLEAALGSRWSFIALANEVSSRHPVSRLRVDTWWAPATQQSGSLCSPWNQSVQAMRESLPQVGDAAKSCTEECVCACLHEGCVMCVSFPTTRSSCESGSRMRVVSVGSGAQPVMETGCLLVTPLPHVHPQATEFLAVKAVPCLLPLYPPTCASSVLRAPPLCL